jgi:ribose transport system substrate-binding protein
MRGTRSIAVAVGVAAACTMAACGSSEEKGSATAGSSSAKKTYEITFIPGLKGNPFYVSMACGARDEAKKIGATVETQGANAFDPTQQIPVVNSVTAKKPDGVLIAPTDAKALVSPMLQMKQQGIELVEVDTKLDDASVSASHVSADNVQGGRAAAEELAREIGSGGGDVLVISLRPGVSTDDLRVQGFQEGVKEHPELHLIGVQYNDEKPEKATQIVNSVLAAHPGLKGIFTTDFFGARGAATAVRGAKKEGKVKIVSFDATPDQVDALKSGLVQAIVSQSPYKQGVLGLQRLAGALDGKQVEPETLLPTMVLTQDNVDSVDAKPYLYTPSC